MKIQTSQLDVIFRKITLKLKELDINSVEIDQDYYLLISNADWTKVDEANPEPVTGSLIDDWGSLHKVVTGEHPLMFVDFDRLASILRAISEKLNSEESD
jgi:hypothetical protein